MSLTSNRSDRLHLTRALMEERLSLTSIFILISAIQSQGVASGGLQSQFMLGG